MTRDVSICSDDGHGGNPKSLLKACNVSMPTSANGEAPFKDVEMSAATPFACKVTALTEEVCKGLGKETRGVGSVALVTSVGEILGLCVTTGVWVTRRVCLDGGASLSAGSCVGSRLWVTSFVAKC